MSMSNQIVKTLHDGNSIANVLDEILKKYNEEKLYLAAVTVDSSYIAVLICFRRLHNDLWEFLTDYRIKVSEFYSNKRKTEYLTAIELLAYYLNTSLTKVGFAEQYPTLYKYLQFLIDRDVAE